MAETTPVTLLTGFPGAGKTTLLNHLLRQPALAGAAVLANEFGEIGLDRRRVRKLVAETPDTVQQPAGCLCCTVRDDLARALREFLPHARLGKINRVVIATTGLADPVPILATLLRDTVAASAYRLDGIVTVVDALHGDATLDAQDEAVRQVAVADRIVLSKTDLAGDAGALRARLRRLNPGAPVLDVRHGVADPAAVLGGGGFDIAGKGVDVRAWLAAEAFAATAHTHHPHDRNRHDARIQAFCLTFDQPLQRQRVDEWLARLTGEHGESLLRIKGILHISGQDRPMVLHGVQHLLHPPVLLHAWPEDDPRTSRLVFITRDLPRAAIEGALPACNAVVRQAASPQRGF
jgi:G3E family GTPase